MSSIVETLKGAQFRAKLQHYGFHKFLHVYLCGKLSCKWFVIIFKKYSLLRGRLLLSFLWHLDFHVPCDECGRKEKDDQKAHRISQNSVVVGGPRFSKSLI